MRMRFFAAVLAAFAVPAGALAQSAMTELEVNTYTTSAQWFPAVAGGTDGSFVVVWESEGQDGAGGGIFGQRFDALGQKAGTEFQVNTDTTGVQRDPAVARLSDGGFIVVWRGESAGIAEDDVFGQRFDAAGSKVGGEFLVNTTTVNTQENPDVAADANGGFVVVWESYVNPTDGKTVSGQRFDAFGARVGSEFKVPFPGYHQSYPKVASRPEGDFLVVWQHPNGNGSGRDGVLGHYFDANGDPVGTSFLVPSYTAGTQFRPAIAAGPSGTFVVVWESNRDHSGYADLPIFGQRFNSAGERVGPEFPVSTNNTAALRAPSIAVDAAGRMLVDWPCPTADFDVCAQRLDRFGARVGTAFTVNSATAGFELDSSVAWNGSGFTVAWRGYDADSAGVKAGRSKFAPQPFRVDAHGGAGTSSDQNGVLEPGEAVLVEPAWKRVAPIPTPVVVFGSAPSLTGPPGGIYLVNHGEAAYSSVSDATAALDCYTATASHDCYVVSVAGPRPATHWDALLEETLSLSGGGLQPWTLHVGDSFTDVPRSQPFYQKIETLLHYGITGGCTATAYCPSSPVARDQMSIFIAKGIAGVGENVPSFGTLLGSSYLCGPGGHSLFADVAATDAFCKHVHYLAVQNVTLGCGVAAYCPAQTVTRDAMASFIAKAIVAPKGGNGVPQTYGPDPGTGLSYSCAAGSPSVHFTDVPASNPFCKHIHYLWAKGVVSGCTATAYCPGQTVTRDAMAKFIANGFGLRLYAP